MTLGLRLANCSLFCLAQRRERPLVRPLNQLGEIRGGKASHFDNGDPMIASPVSCRFDAGDVGQLDKPLRRDLRAETPSFGGARFEISELPAADRVDEEIARAPYSVSSAPQNPLQNFLSCLTFIGVWFAANDKADPRDDGRSDGSDARTG